MTALNKTIQRQIKFAQTATSRAFFWFRDQVSASSKRFEAQAFLTLRWCEKRLIVYRI